MVSDGGLCVGPMGVLDEAAGGWGGAVARNEPKHTEEKTRLEKRPDEWCQFSRLAPPVFIPCVSELTAVWNWIVVLCALWTRCGISLHLLRVIACGPERQSRKEQDVEERRIRERKYLGKRRERKVDEKYNKTEE